MSEPSELLTPERIFRDHAPRIFHLARRMLGSESDAEDVLQEVLLTVIRKLKDFRGDSSLTTWLHRVTVNTALMHRRKQASRELRERSDPMEQFSDEGIHTQPIHGWANAPDQPLLQAERRSLLEQAITRMPEILRDVLILADIEELPNAEVADVLQLSVPAVKTRLHRARQWLRNELAPHFEEPSR
ncbi:RNA polymerase sigma factor [Tuwongella immobilis]|uniref:RNA polymerase sigma factor n=1 Tax=Tuwongella immobilis TaxID=692036 RepID=A0A6C2YYE6_9BACT|nr:sigma-70 family RNA polymerase sigma factor [Tuwongella immobilis]VIP05745.1 rna polymerase sigma 70 : Uncharacterized protein OS=Candidatus Entotheonella sp. TSY2 GN=ETSY2_46890 PE=4 SV=1: Sigma70_r2: Sigma70_r4_2 [Tuwongella immobilis]VTS08846.1 rna polymerase sigma 70 : Uncharacterized protein OS=Candidatus Entotheonella sp. TSY2 GN=ETSY2_46890 PE=4 SV=1: Sigma70_r2: Sigma70_r4_2 [Tuwongella immobilis]